MRRISLKAYLLPAAALLMGVLACNLPGGGNDEAPTVLINSPAGGAEFEVGSEVPIQSTAAHPDGVARIELRVGGAVIRTDSPPDGEPLALFSLIQSWTPTTTGQQNIEVIAYTEDDVASEPATLSLNIIEAQEDEGEEADEEEEEQCTARSNTDLNVRTGPGAPTYPIAGILGLGQTANVTGRDSSGTWWQIEFASAPGGRGWVSATYVTTSGDCASVEQVAAPPPPAGGGSSNPTATTAPTATSSTPPTATPTGAPTATATQEGEPDLRVASISVPSNITFTLADYNESAGVLQRTVTISAVIENVGATEADESFQTVVYPTGRGGPGGSVNMGTIANLDPGESVTLKVDYVYGGADLDAGTYTLEVETDSADSIDEADEGNNIRTTAVTIAYDIDIDIDIPDLDIDLPDFPGF